MLRPGRPPGNTGVVEDARPEVTPNRYGATCCGCGCRVEALDGYLRGRDRMTGRWLVECRKCGQPEPEPQPAPAEPKPQVMVGEDDPIRQLFEAMFFGFDSGPSVPPCFATLGIEPTASQADVKRAYRELAKRHHPDVGGSAEAFAEIESAYRRALAQTGGSR